MYKSYTEYKFANNTYTSVQNKIFTLTWSVKSSFSNPSYEFMVDELILIFPYFSRFYIIHFHTSCIFFFFCI